MRGTKENSGFSGPVGRQASAGQIPALVGPVHHIQGEERKRRRIKMSRKRHFIDNRH
ncbi:hypothetical protein PAMP_022513 [Pampus punctatissimus]